MLSESVVAKFREGTSEAPTFASVDLYDTPYEYRDDSELPYLRADVAVYNCKVDYSDGNLYARMAVLGVQHLGDSDIYRKLDVGDYLTRNVEDMDGKLLEPSKDLTTRYQDFLNLHANSPYIVTARLYGPYVVPEGKKFIYGQAEEIDGSEQVFDLEGKTLKNGQPVDSLDTACQWMIENQRAYLQGMCISQHIAGDRSKPVPSGDLFFTEQPCPCTSYPEGTYENAENRLIYAAQQADNFGTVAGGPTADEILREIRSRERNLPSVDKTISAEREKQMSIE